jgi:hypothetical protein
MFLTAIQTVRAEQVRVCVTLCNFIRMMFGSNLSWDISYSKVFRRLPQSLQENVGIVARLGQDRVLPNPFHFLIHQSLYHSRLYRLNTDTIVK